MTLKNKTNLLTLDQAYAELQKTEPLSTTLLSSDTKVKIELEGGLAADLSTVTGTAPVGAFITIDGVERQMSRDAVLQAGAHFGLTAAYMKRAPAHLVEHNLNYWYSAGLDDQMLTALSVGETVQAFTPYKHVPFSNVDLIEQIVGWLSNTVGGEILVDWKFQNNLVKTDVRLILADTTYELDSADDVWSHGIHVSNSLIGKTMTSVENYFYRWTNGTGLTSDIEGEGDWNRRLNGQEEMDMWEWAQERLTDLLNVSDDRMRELESLGKLPITNLTETTREVFTAYKVPQKSRPAVLDALVADKADELTMYSVVTALMAAANSPDLPDAKRDLLMRVAGSIPTARFSPEKAKVFSEGQKNPKGPNPYVIPTVVPE